MNSRERIAALLRREIPDRMGIYEHWWPETLRDAWPAQGYPKDAAPEEHFDFDMVNVGGWFDSSPYPGIVETLEETDEWIVRRDGRGAALKYWKHKSGTPEHVSFDCSTSERWFSHYREPLLAADYSRLGDLEAVKRNMARARERGKFCFFGNLFVFELLRGTVGDTNFLPALLLEPEWIRDFCQVHLDMWRTMYTRMIEVCGLPDGFWIYEDFGFSNGLFCSPKVLGDLIMPYERELVEFFHSYDRPVILHSCGDVRKAVPLIVEAGFDCLQPMEAKAGCNVVEIAKEFLGRIALMGNIDVVKLGTNDLETVRQEVEAKVRPLREMRAPYIFHSDHSVPPDIQYATYAYAVEVFRELGEYA
jgi:uroporphyrinogen decarboxylase